jgi:hypothetical protein
MHIWAKTQFASHQIPVSLMIVTNICNDTGFGTSQRCFLFLYTWLIECDPQ